jgi:hypothetical protein
MLDKSECPKGKVALFPPNGGEEPTLFLERHVEQKLLDGWVFEPVSKKQSVRKRRPVKTSADVETVELKHTEEESE